MIKYTCNNCGQIHEKWPALTFNSPDGYAILPDDLKEQIAELDTDFCVIRHAEQTDRFIRVTLTQNVKDHCEDLDYGVWVSLSEKSFQDYADNFGNSAETTYFGWLSNDIPGYEFKEGIPTTVQTRSGGLRPEKLSLDRDYREKIIQHPPVLHCKVSVPPWLNDKTKKFDINWEHYEWRTRLKLFWARLF